MKIIAVYGNSGSGKSTVAGMIARYSAERCHLKTVIMSCDNTTPMMPIWMPQEKIDQYNSLGNIFTSDELAIDTVAKRIQVYKPLPNIGFLAYTAEDCFIDYSLDYQKIIDAIKMTRETCDVLIIDCATPLSDITVPAAIEMADKTVCVLTPDLKGVSYYRSNIRLLAAEKFNIQNQIKIMNKVKNYNATKEVSESIGSVNFVFPYNADIENSMLCGDTANNLKYCDKNYKGFFESLGLKGVVNNGTK